MRNEYKRIFYCIILSDSQQMRKMVQISESVFN